MNLIQKTPRLACILLLLAFTNPVALSQTDCDPTTCQGCNEIIPDNKVRLISRLGTADNWTDICPSTHAVVPVEYSVATRQSGQVLTVKCVPCCSLGCSSATCATTASYPYTNPTENNPKPAEIYSQVGSIQGFMIYGTQFGCAACGDGEKIKEMKQVQVKADIGANVTQENTGQVTSTNFVSIFGKLPCCLASWLVFYPTCSVLHPGIILIAPFINENKPKLDFTPYTYVLAANH